MFTAVRFEGIFGCDHNSLFVAALFERRSFDGHGPPLQVDSTEMLLKKFQIGGPVALRKESTPALPGSVFRVSGVPRRTLSLRRPASRNGRLAPHLSARLGRRDTAVKFACRTDPRQFEETRQPATITQGGPCRAASARSGFPIRADAPEMFVGAYENFPI